MERVKVSKKVAEAIGYLKLNGQGNELILKAVLGNASGSLDSLIITLKEFVKERGFNTLLYALVNDYEVEITDRDRVRKVISEFCNGAIVSDWVIDEIQAIYRGVKPGE